MNMHSGPLQGVVVGKVTDLEDPMELARVKVEYSFLGQYESDWARIATLMAGPDRGTLYRPEVGDEVLLAFEMGSPQRPFMIGALWNSEDKPPAMGPEPPTNNWRVIRSRSGHVFRLNDQEGEETVELIDKDEMRSLVFDVKNKQVNLFAKDSGDTITIKAEQGTIVIEAAKEVNIKSIESEVNIEGNTAVNVKANQVSIQATAGLSLQGGTVDIKSDGPVTVNGAIIKLN